MKPISFKLEEKDLEKLKEKAKESGKNRSEFIRDKIFDSDTSDTNGDTSEITNCCKQLILFFDKIFDLDFSPGTIQKMLKILEENIDEKLIEKVRDQLELES